MSRPEDPPGSGYTHPHPPDTNDHHHARRTARHPSSVSMWERAKGIIRPHSHDHAESLDDALMVSRAGTRALAMSLAGLLTTAIIQLLVFAGSGSVGLLADTIHNFADALTALPVGLAFVVARRPATRRYTYGYGRAEDLAGLTVVAVMAISAAVAASEAIDRLIHPQQIGNLGWVAVAGAVGFAGNELAARYRIKVGTRIGSAALVADGRHARTDGFTSLAVVAGAIGVALGWRQADPIIGVAITVAILSVLRSATRDVYRRLMDAVDPELVGDVEHEVSSIAGVQAVTDVRVRWVGHELRTELNITVDQDLHVAQAHQIAETVRHDLLHHVRRLTDATIHINPCGHDGTDHHTVTAHHYHP